MTTTMIDIVFVATVIAMNDCPTERWCFTNSNGTDEFDLLVRWLVYVYILIPIVPK
jgi:hypothetical protein